MGKKQKNKKKKSKGHSGRKHSPAKQSQPNSNADTNILSEEHIAAQSVPDFLELQKTVLSLASPEDYFKNPSFSRFEKGATLAAFYKRCHERGFSASDSSTLSAFHLFVLTSLIDAVPELPKRDFSLKDSVYLPFFESLFYTIYVLKDWHPAISTHLIRLHVIHVFESLSGCTQPSSIPAVVGLFPYDLNAWHFLMNHKRSFGEALLQTLFTRDLPAVHHYLGLKEGEEPGCKKPYLLSLSDKLLMSIPEGQFSCVSLLLDILFHAMSHSQTLTLFLLNSFGNSLAHFTDPRVSIPFDQKLYLLTVSFMFLECSIELTGKYTMPVYMWASFCFPKELRSPIIKVALSSLIGAIDILQNKSITIRTPVPEENAAQLPLAICYESSQIKKSRDISVYYEKLLDTAKSYQPRLNDLSVEEWLDLKSLINRLIRESKDLRLRIFYPTQRISASHAERILIFLLNPSRVNDCYAYTSPQLANFTPSEKNAFFSQLTALILSHGDAFFNRAHPLYLAITSSSWLSIKDVISYLYRSNHLSIALQLAKLRLNFSMRKGFLAHFLLTWRSRLFLPPSKDLLPRRYNQVPAWIDDITKRLYRLCSVFNDQPQAQVSIILPSLWAILQRFQSDAAALYMTLTNPSPLPPSINENALLNKATRNVWSHSKLQAQLNQCQSFIAHASCRWLSHPSLSANMRVLLCYALAKWGGAPDTPPSSPIESLSALMNMGVSVRAVQAHSP